MLFLISLLLSLWPQAAVPQAPPADVRPCRVEFDPAKAKAKVGDKIELQILVRDAADLFSAPFHLLYDAETISIDDITEGDFLGGDGKRTVFLKSIQPQRGRVIVGLARLGDVGGRTGSGKLVTVKVTARKQGSTQMTLEKLDFRKFDLKMLVVKAGQFTLKVE